MVLEMKRALEDLKKGADGAYRKIYDATYEEVYCKSFLITQEEKQALSLVEDFYAGVLKEIGEALKAEDQNLWFWQQYYKKIRREYQKLLSGIGSELKRHKYQMEPGDKIVCSGKSTGCSAYPCGFQNTGPESFCPMLSFFCS